MSNTDRHRRISSLFLAACELKADERAALLGRECADDGKLRKAVERLLVRHAETSGFLSESAMDIVAHAHDDGAPPEPLGPGSVIGRYKLLQQIGEGGFGIVYMAQQQEPVRRRVALKILKLGMDSRQVIARFEAEQQALALMDHPNIAKVLDAGITGNGRPYFVMELVKGEPITTYCDRNHVPTRERLRAFIEVCQAVQHAHQKGIIHRDLKPSNVLMTMSDGRPVPRIIDFGIAKALNRELTDKTLFTEFHQFLGTPQYMSPEQAEMTSNDIDTRSDIYSLGVLLYELLTGTTPFDSRRLRSAAFEEILRIIREEEPEKPSTRLDHLRTTGATSKEDDSSIRSIADHRQSEPASLSRMMHGDLDWIVMKCLEKDRIRRYETADGLSRDIGRYLSDEMVSAGPPRATYRLRKFVRRNRVAVAVIGLVAASLVLGIIGTSWQALRATTAEVDATRELARATEVKRLLRKMLTRVNPMRAQGTDITLMKSMLDDAAERLTRGEVTDELIEAELRGIVGQVYIELGLYEDAERHLPLSLETYQRLLGAEDRETLAAMSQLGWLYLEQGHATEAEGVLEEALDIQRRVLGNEDSDTLLTSHRLAGAFKDQGRYAAAEPLLEQVIQTSERLGGADEPRRLAALHDMAGVYLKQKRYGEAETLLLETGTTMRRVLGEFHPWTLNCMSSLAAVYEKQDRNAEAEETYRKVLELRKRVLPEDHPATLRTRTSLAELLLVKREFQEAEIIYREVFEIRESVLGAGDALTLGAMNNLALIYEGLRRHPEAEALLVRAVAKLRHDPGEEHPDTLNVMAHLASLYRDLGKHAEAEALFVETLAIRRREFAAEDTGTLEVMTRLAGVYKRLDQHTKAELLYLEVLEIRKRVPGDEARGTLGALTNLGLLYNSMGRFDDARLMFETSLPAKRRTLSPDDPWTWIAVNGLADAYEGLNRRADAAPLREESLDRDVRRAREIDADALTLNGAAWNLLTHDYEELRDPELALELALSAAKLTASREPGVLDTLALARHLTGDTARAAELQRTCLQLLPPNAPLDVVAHHKAELARYEAALAGNKNGGR